MSAWKADALPLGDSRKVILLYHCLKRSEGYEVNPKIIPNQLFREILKGKVCQKWHFFCFFFNYIITLGGFIKFIVQGDFSNEASRILYI
jgi:hypothetical protein